MKKKKFNYGLLHLLWAIPFVILIIIVVTDSYLADSHDFDFCKSYKDDSFVRRIDMEHLNCCTYETRVDEYGAYYKEEVCKGFSEEVRGIF